MTLILFKGEQIVRVFRESQLEGKFMDILGFEYSGESDFLTVHFMEEGNDKSQSIAYQFPDDFDRLSVEHETPTGDSR